MSAESAVEKPFCVCSGCGLKSTRTDLFRFTRLSATEVRRLCPMCDDERKAGEGHARYIAAFLVGVGLFFFITPLAMVCFAISIGFLLMIPIHEFAHAAMAKLVRMHVYEIALGENGRPLWEFQWGRCRITIKRGLNGGHIVPCAVSTRWWRCRYGLVIAAGPAVHVVAIWLLWPDWSASNGGPVWTLFILFGLLTNAFLLWYSLVPPSSVNWSTGRYNDAVLLWRVMFSRPGDLGDQGLSYIYHEAIYHLGRRDLSAMRRVLADGLREFTEHLWLQSLDAVASVLQGERDASRKVFERLLSHPEGTPDSHAYTRMHLAWLELASYPSLDRVRVEELTRESMDELPWIALFQNIRGCALIANGHDVDGLAWIDRAQRDNSWYERALGEAYRALASMRRGDLDEALRCLDRAAEQDPHLPVVTAIRRELSARVEP